MQERFLTPQTPFGMTELLLPTMGVGENQPRRSETAIFGGLDGAEYVEGLRERALTGPEAGDIQERFLTPQTPFGMTELLLPRWGLGETSREEVKRLFSADLMVQNTLKVYESVL